MYETIKGIEDVAIADRQLFERNAVIAGCENGDKLLEQLNHAYRRLQEQATRLGDEDAENRYEATANLRHAGGVTICVLELEKIHTPDVGHERCDTLTKVVLNIEDGEASYRIDYRSYNHQHSYSTKYGERGEFISQFADNMLDATR